jgi:pilus assembly protein CpaB
MARLRGFVWLAAGLVVAVLAGIVAFVTLSTAAPSAEEGAGLAPPSVTVVVAARRIEVRSLLTAEDLELKEVPVDVVPETALRQTEEAVGKLTMVELYAGEIILEQQVVAPDLVAANGRTAVLINDDQVLMAYPRADLMSGLNVMKPGDHVDLFFTMNLPADALTEGRPGPIAIEQESEQTTFVLLQNVVIAQILGGEEEGSALLLTLDPQDALVLKYVTDAGANLDIVVRAPGVEGEFDTYPVELDYLINRYRTTEEPVP